MFDIAIIGGGPAGMAAAITAATANPALKICIVEKNPSLGKKIQATGNGKCNLSNTQCEKRLEVMGFFEDVGILTRTDESGRLYPASEQASDVVDSLVNALHKHKVAVFTQTAPMDISFLNPGFEIVCQNLTLKCAKLLLATGGKAGPQYGSTGDGYPLAKKMGHQVTRLYPVLSPLECQGSYKKLKGIRVKAEISLEKDDKALAVERGEVQFTEDGVSGICTFNLSRFLALDGTTPYEQALRQYRLSIDFSPTISAKALTEILASRAANCTEPMVNMLLTVVPRGIAADVLAKSISDDIKSPSQLTDRDIQEIVHTLKNWKTTITGVKGWQKAQVTGGGVKRAEQNDSTMESNITPGLYLAGEILDYDGPSGGYNLHFAWLSGIKAGKAMASVQV